LTQESKKPVRGEMRRRHEAIIRSGVLGKIRSEGRLVFALALCWADYEKCQFRMSVRGAAKVSGVQPTSIRRGIDQLLAAGVIEAGPGEPGKRQRYRFILPSKDGGHTRCAPRDTPRVQRAHTGCPGRTHPVSSAHTPRVPYSSIVLKGSSRTREDSGRSGPGGPAVQEVA